MSRLMAKIKGKKVGVVGYYRIGDIKLSMNEENPGIIYGGTWELIAKGTTLAGINEADPDKNSKTSFNQAPKTIIGSKWIHRHIHGRFTHSCATEAGGYGLVQSVSFQNRVTIEGLLEDHNTNIAGDGDAQNIQPTTLCYIWMKTAN